MPPFVRKPCTKAFPTLSLSKDGWKQGYVLGLTYLGYSDALCTKGLGLGLDCSEIFNYSGNLMRPPGLEPKETRGKCDEVKDENSPKTDTPRDLLQISSNSEYPDVSSFF